VILMIITAIYFSSTYDAYQHSKFDKLRLWFNKDLRLLWS